MFYTLNMLSKYANLITHYSLQLKPNQKVLIKSTTLAEPLIKELYKALLKRGCYVEVDLAFEDQDRLFYDYANTTQLKTPSEFYSKAIFEFDALVRIMAPHNLKSTASVCSEKKKVVQEAHGYLRKKHLERSAKKELQWTLCVYPTQAAAQEAKLSLREYEDFIFKSCMLYCKDPIKAWQNLSKGQDALVQYLNKANSLRYVGDKTDLSFSTKNRVWINSDGHHNMPSGEVFTGPVEDSVNGEIFFNYPTVYEGTDVEGIHLSIEKGLITRWSAQKGQEVLDRVFDIKGARHFGEVAIGTNYAIQRATKNILFDEKMGGSIHMAVGASYPETGGKNEASVHWDMIKDMKNGGKIYVDDKLIYENGRFIIKEAKLLGSAPSS